MKRILVLSDSHGDIIDLMTAISSDKWDLVVHLGDCKADLLRVKNRFEGLAFENVSGNCDFDMLSESEKIVEVDGKKILLCHGHTYNVKAGYLNLEMAARQKGVDVALFGHTHKVFYDNHNGIVMMNPGSIGAPPFDVPPSYGILTINDDGTISTDIRYME